SAKVRLETMPSGNAALTFSHPCSFSKSARIAELSRTDLLITHLAGRLGAPVCYQLINEAHTGREKAADHFLSAACRLLIGVDTQLVAFETDEHLVTLLHAKGGPHWRRDNETATRTKLHFLG